MSCLSFPRLLRTCVYDFVVLLTFVAFIISKVNLESHDRSDPRMQSDKETKNNCRSWKQIRSDISYLDSEEKTA